MRCRRSRLDGRVLSAPIVVGAVALVMTGAPAGAWQTRVCANQGIRWANDRIPLSIMPCSAPPGSHRSRDLLAVMDAWNSVPGSAARLEADVGPPACRIDVNGRSEVGYVDPKNLDGARGLTRLIYTRACGYDWRGGFQETEAYIIETDVVIADFGHDVPGLPTNCDQISRTQPLRRPLLLHELGHVLGLWHEDDEMAAMNTGSSGGRYCGPRAFDPHPDDRAGVRYLYADGSPPVRDVAALGFELTEPNYTRPIMGRGNYAVCPGDVLEVRWAVANQGTVDAITRVQWYFSDNDIISRQDLAAEGSERVAVGVGEVYTGASEVRVPALPRGPDGQSGPWWVGFVVDADGPRVELPATNNWTYTQFRVWARDPVECEAPE